VLESLFKRTTDITLLELTDYNHPLLRRMQLEAPGTYHHSLVVAQLSENACNAIGAHPAPRPRLRALPRHRKNQQRLVFRREHARPHEPARHAKPFDSARIIKQHVTDGVELAHKHNLPRHRRRRSATPRHDPRPFLLRTRRRRIPGALSARGARGRRRRKEPETGQADCSYPASRLPPSVSSASPDEAAFRYDGPRPQFKESAIISLADGVEAPRVRSAPPPEVLRELIDRIVRERSTNDSSTKPR